MSSLKTRFETIDLNNAVINQCGTCCLPCSGDLDLSDTKMEDIEFVGGTILVRGQNIHEVIPFYEH